MNIPLSSLRTALLITSGTFLFLSACGGPREPGPLEGDQGRITYWEVTSSASENSGCTDSPDFADTIEPAEFGDNSYLIYRVENGGDQATSQDCETLDASTCSDDDILVFDIQGSSLTWIADPDIFPIDGSTCSLEFNQQLKVVDEGDLGTFEVIFTVDLVGDVDACAALNNNIAAQGTNGFGLDGCVITTDVELEFHSTQ